MNSSPDVRLLRLLGGEHLATLRKRLRGRFERAPLDINLDSFRIDKLTVEEHAALASLLGRPQHYSCSLQIDLRSVDAAFQSAGIAASLRDALERIDGPITHRASARIALQTLWSDVIGVCGHAGLSQLLQTPAGMGLLKRIARQSPGAATEICRRAEAVLQRLPARGLTRSQLAADVLGDAHALDSGQPTAALVLAVWRRLSPQVGGSDCDPKGDPVDDGSPKLGDGAERDRDVWANAGILVNELARPVLFLNLPTRGDAIQRRPAGEPSYLSLRSLLRSPPSWDMANRTVYVCENPNLVAIAADHWGADCAPLVCTDGMPAAAQRCLLLQLAKAGARLRYHGDFDWPGLHIGNQVMREHGAQPWRFGAADYAAAAARISLFGQPLQGKTVAAHWDGELTTAMEQHRVAIPEEFLADSLLQDLVTSRS